MRLPLTLDHLAVAGETLTAAEALAADALGIAGLAPGGRHAAMATHNRVIGLDDGLYVEAIAIDPDAPAPGRARWFGLDGFSGPPRLQSWVCRTTDLAATLAEAPGAGQPVTLSRGPYRWSMAVPEDGALPFDGLFPALIEWWGPAHPVTALPKAQVRLLSLELHHPDAPALSHALAPLIEDPRLSVHRAPTPSMRACFDTQSGARWLT